MAIGQISVCIDADEVLDELSDEDLLAELKSRGLNPLGLIGLGERDLIEVRRAVLLDDGRRVVDLLKPLFSKGPVGPWPTQRDPSTGRPLI